MQFDESYTLFTTARAAGCVILDEARRILLVQQAKDPFRGLWHLPMGTIEEGERPEDAAVREALEEAGVNVRLGAFLNTYLGRYSDGGLVQRFVWEAEILPGETVPEVPTEEIMARRWFTHPEFLELYQAGQVRMHHTRLAFEEALQHVGQ
ncbi:NUDIX domain-containing protein [Deinococcus cellulosilyticus]|uniref:DNA mismatch repair protein MutT n=1 Tax=Deinococcus cellulosilyticus (strain DSM 18568 / NBRC 106333 / KACC 11606 / 5516J-15) TaxID=1223518 RepID=A0A511N0U5_DEIC1|nr:NUDIX domain-containing protein [Deinococcus cellulosilyticus]GEM46474.1 DNA mismatch repair protein MutT [Deinococcus cellulosilyticus NBRC 106333 = KACC 11606]